MSRIGRNRPAGTYQSSAALSERSSRDEPQDHELLPQPMIPKLIYSVFKRILLSVQNHVFCAFRKRHECDYSRKVGGSCQSRRESSG